MKKHQDAYGQAMYDYYKKGDVQTVVIERDDGYLDSDYPISVSVR